MKRRREKKDKKSGPSHSDWMKLVENSIRSNRFEEAIEYLESIDDERTRRSGAAREVLGKVYRLKGDVDKAIEIFDELRKVDLYRPSIELELGKCFALKGNIDKAIYHFEQAIVFLRKSVGPVRVSDLISIQRELADCLKLKGDMKGVISCLQKVLQYNPYDESTQAELQKCSQLDCDPVTRVEIAERLRLGGDLNGAIFNFKRVHELQPDNALALRGWGNCLKLMGDTDGAIQKFEEALKLQPEDLLALKGLIECLKLNGDFDKAILHLEKLYKLDPNAFVLGAWGDCLRLKNDLDGAIAILKESLRLQPNAFAYGALGDCLRSKNDLDEAIFHFEKALQSKPNFDKAFVLRGWAGCLELKGDLDGAILKFKELLELKPDDPFALRKLIECLELKGDLHEVMLIKERLQLQEVISQVPNEILAYILHCSSPSTLFQWRRVSSFFRKEMERDETWERFYKNVPLHPLKSLFQVSYENLGFLSCCNPGIAFRVFNGELLIGSGIDILKQLSSIQKFIRPLKEMIDVEPVSKMGSFRWGRLVKEKFSDYTAQFKEIVLSLKLISKKEELEGFFPHTLSSQQELLDFIDQLNLFAELFLSWDGISYLLNREQPLITILDLKKECFRKLIHYLISTSELSYFPVKSDTLPELYQLMLEMGAERKRLRDRILKLTAYLNPPDLFTDEVVYKLFNKIGLFFKGVEFGAHPGLITLEEIFKLDSCLLSLLFHSENGIELMKKDPKAISALLDDQKYKERALKLILNHLGILQFINFSTLIQKPHPYFLTSLLTEEILTLFQVGQLIFKDGKLFEKDKNLNLFDLSGPNFKSRFKELGKRGEEISRNNSKKKESEVPHHSTTFQNNDFNRKISHSPSGFEGVFFPPQDKERERQDKGNPSYYSGPPFF